MTNDQKYIRIIGWVVYFLAIITVTLEVDLFLYGVHVFVIFLAGGILLVYLNIEMADW